MHHSNAEVRSLSPKPGRFESVEDALGVLRDAMATLSNVNTLLRSPKVGGKALQAVVPGLQEQRRPSSEAIAYLAAHLTAHEATRPAAEVLAAYTAEVRDRFGHALDRASVGLQGARERLAFENELEHVLAELRTTGELTRLLLAALDAKTTDIDLREAIEHAFANSRRGTALRQQGVSAVLAVSDASHAVHACPAILMPLITLAAAVVHGTTGAQPSIVAEHRADGSIALVVSDAPAEGDSLLLHPPRLIPPLLPCAEAAAHLAGFELSVREDGREVVLRWPRG